VLDRFLDFDALINGLLTVCGHYYLSVRNFLEHIGKISHIVVGCGIVLIYNWTFVASLLSQSRLLYYVGSSH
jgi:hypothetical protein